MRTAPSELIVILGLSDDPSRYAFKAAQALHGKGYRNVKGVHPEGGTVLGIEVVNEVEAIASPIHTLTMYIGPAKSEKLTSSILAVKPQRIIFNPGSENPALIERARAEGIEVLEACTLVLLSVGQF